MLQRAVEPGHVRVEGCAAATAAQAPMAWSSRGSTRTRAAREHHAKTHGGRGYGRPDSSRAWIPASQLALSPTVPCSRQPDGLPAPSSEVMRRAILGGGAPASRARWPPHLHREVGVQRLVDVESLTCASGRKRGRLRHHRRALPLAPNS
jgi:hypothetical protein